MGNKYQVIEKPQTGYPWPAYEVWKGGRMVSRHPNKCEAANAAKRFKKQDTRKKS